jgi:predicted Zn-dependent peptidase
VIEEAKTTKPFTSEELDGYKVRVRASKIAAVEDNGRFAGELAQAQMLYGGWSAFFREQERLQSLRPEDLTAVMRASLVNGNRTVAMITNPPADAAVEGGR